MEVDPLTGFAEGIASGVVIFFSAIASDVAHVLYGLGKLLHGLDYVFDPWV